MGTMKIVLIYRVQTDRIHSTSTYCLSARGNFVTLEVEKQTVSFNKWHFNGVIFCSLGRNLIKEKIFVLA